MTAIHISFFAHPEIEELGGEKALLLVPGQIASELKPGVVPINFARQDLLNTSKCGCLVVSLDVWRSMFNLANGNVLPGKDRWKRFKFEELKCLASKVSDTNIPALEVVIRQAHAVWENYGEQGIVVVSLEWTPNAG